MFSSVNCQTTVKAMGKLNKETIEKEYQRSLEISRNVSRILDQLLKGYDKRLRPNYAGLLISSIHINIDF